MSDSSPRLTALVALARDRGATAPERALAAEHAARTAARAGIDYLSLFPAGLPVVDDEYEPIDWDEEVAR